MEYLINKFLFYVLPNGETVLQNENGIVEIHDPRMNKMLSNWDVDNSTSVLQSNLKEIFEDETQDAINFLTSYGIIQEKVVKVLKIEGISILANDNMVEHLLRETLSNDYPDLNISRYSLDDYSEFYENQLVVVFLDKYNKNIGLKIRNMARENDSSTILMSYIYNNKFYLDCLFSKEWMVPCHSCHIGHIESQLYIGDNEELTYQQIVSSLYTLDSEFKIGMPLKHIHKINIARLLINKIEHYVNDFNMSLIHPQDITNCTLLDLKDLKIYEDTSLFWEMCDCYE